MIENISHITLIVRNLEKSAHMLKDIMDAEEIYDSSGRNYSLSREKFFLIGKTWFVLMEGDPLHDKTYNHIAFSIQDDQFELYYQKIKNHGLEVLPGRPRIPGEGRSIYFYDHDNHLFELHCGTLEVRLKRYTAGT